MFRRAIAELCLVLLSSATQARPAPDTACGAEAQLLVDAKPIAGLPKAQRDQIMHVLLPDLKRFYALVGGNSQNLQLKNLQKLLHFKAIPGGTGGEQLIIVRLVDDSCGAHENCVAYVVSLKPAGARNLLIGRNSSYGESAGGAVGVGILAQHDPTHPMLLFWGHISASETGVGCFEWQNDHYINMACPAECNNFPAAPLKK
jgi:hypothetical protein